MQAPKFPVWFKGKAGVLTQDWASIQHCWVPWAIGFVPSLDSAVLLENVQECFKLWPW